MRTLLLLVFSVTLATTGAFAKGHSPSHSHRSTKSPSGTGSKASSTSVGSYTTKKGTHVASYKRTTPDNTKKNNYSTKGNVNSSTGKAGTQTATK